MRRRLGATLAASIAAVALLAGCTSGSDTGALGQTSVGQGSPKPSPSAPAPSTPSVASVSPASGSLVGGATATITGTDLTGVDKVTFNGTAATDVAVVSETKVTAVVPSAVNYQPSSGAVSLFKGATAVTAKTAPTFTWSVQTPVDKEMQYAFAHWSGTTYNTAYYDFNDVGGDCQNFVSQSLEAAGMPQTDDWFYNSQGSHSESWGYAPTFDSMLEDTPSLGFTKLTDDERSDVTVGDLAYFDWNDNDIPDHTMIVSGVSTVDGKTKISLAGHNLDSDYRDLDVAITHDHPGASVWFWKLPASLTK